MRVLSHSPCIQCCSCKGYTHLNCIPYVNKCDSIFIERNMNDWLCTCCTESLFPFNHVYDDDEFMRILSECWPVSLDRIAAQAKIQDKIFSPFELNEDVYSPFMDIDPDSNYYGDTINDRVNSCDYYMENSFNKKCQDIGITNNYLSLIHSNIRSIPKNIDHFEEYLSSLETKFSFIALSETWLKADNCDFYGLQGYTPEHNVRNGKVGGGVSLYIKDGIDYTRREDLCVMNNFAETLFIEIDKDVFNYDKNVIIGVLYRPPDTDMKTFNVFINDLTSRIKTESKCCYILGDYNINLLNVDQHNPTQEFTDIMYSQALFPCITKPTRITRNSATLIDNIFCSDIGNNEFTGILYADISDHFPVFCISKSIKLSVKETPVKTRIYSAQNINKFVGMLESHEWNTVFSESDAQNAYTKFHTDFCAFYETCFPIRVCSRNYQNRKPWLSEGLKTSIRIKNRMYRLCKKHNSPEMEQRYKQYRNNLHALLKTAERDHYDLLLNKYKSNLKKSWTIIKEVINKNRTVKSSSKFLINDKCVSDKATIANGFNSYFVNIGSNLADCIPNTDKSPLDNMGTKNDNSFFIHPALDSEVKNIVKGLKSGSTGWDSISAAVIKTSINYFVLPLTYILNLSLTTGVFPHELKIARVIPLLKAGDPMQLSNYRPVSVLPLFSKILERLMYNRMISFINKHKLLYKFQFGFREGHSTNLAMIYLVDKISNAIESGDFVLGLFLDFTKAFDTVNHAILLKKLEFYGFRGIALQWFESYLSGREQYVDYQGVSSSKNLLTCGVPQGSILGPLLFLLYINDLSNVSSILFSMLFADDSNMFLCGKDVNELIRSLNTEIDKILAWLQINKLTLNIKKTHFMLFRKSRVKVSITENVYIRNEIISMVEETKFLGVYIDSFLTWRRHIKYIRGKISRGIGIICKARKYLRESTLLTLYYCFIYPYLHYCIEVWGNTYDSYLDPLLKLQKKTMRLISNSPRYAHTGPLFDRYKVLALRALYQYAVQLFMYKFYHSLLPCIFDNFFVLNAQIHRYNTRQRQCYHTMNVKTNVSMRTVRYAGVNSHNKFMEIISYNCSEFCYKKHLRRYFLSST